MITKALSDGVSMGPRLAGMDQRDADSLAWSLDFAARRLEGALALATRDTGPVAFMLRGVWRAACRELLYLEMMVRRLIVCLAAQVEIVRPPSRPGGGPAARSAPKPVSRAARAPGFGLFDPLDSPNAILARMQAASNPVPTPATTVRAATPGTGAPVVAAGRLLARFAALAQALADPGRQARRLARIMDTRRARAAKGHAVRVTPLRLGQAPALARTRGLSLESSAYGEAERLALKALNRPHADSTLQPPGASEESPPEAHRVAPGPTEVCVSGGLVNRTGRQDEATPQHPLRTLHRSDPQAPPSLGLDTPGMQASPLRIRSPFVRNCPRGRPPSGFT